MAVWQRFHKDIKDLTLWINNAEKVIRETKLPTGDLDIDKAKQEQGVSIQFMNSIIKIKFSDFFL